MAFRPTITGQETVTLPEEARTLSAARLAVPKWGGRTVVEIVTVDLLSSDAFWRYAHALTREYATSSSQRESEPQDKDAYGPTRASLR